MVAHFNIATEELINKCSPYTQFDGYEAASTGEPTMTKPVDFDIKKELFLRWLNPVCQGDTLIRDPNLGPEYIVRVRRGVRKLVGKKTSREPLISSLSNSSGLSNEI